MSTAPRPLAGRERLDQDALELAALYALSALGAPEMEALEREHRGDLAFWAEVRSLREAAAGLAETGPRAKPKRDLWPAIRARVSTPSSAPPPSASSAQPWKRWQADPAVTACVVNGDDSAFEPTDIPGIRVRRLFVDEPADRVTMLVRMDAGASYPAHRHGGVEECFVIQGDLSVGDATQLHAGDYQRMDKDSDHAVQSTRGGCVLLITSSQHDELLG
ncbi:MAG: hypothetical protein EXS08_02865 [Planctomycetes bacterium]|nr:hypothetical protein [Planctomycetota bacterium]